EVFKTLKEGVSGSGMASFATLPVDDRWALVQYVLSLGPPPDQDTPETLAKIGFGPNAPAGGGEVQEAPTVPVDFMIERMAQAEMPATPPPSRPAGGVIEELANQSASGATAATAAGGAQIYQARCAQCHGMNAAGGIRVQSFG